MTIETTETVLEQCITSIHFNFWTFDIYTDMQQDFVYSGELLWASIHKEDAALRV